MTVVPLLGIYALVINISCVFGEIDWSTREIAQQWFNDFALKFNEIISSGDSVSNLIIDYADDVIDCNSMRCYDNKQELMKDLDVAFKLLASFDAYFDIKIWSKKQVLSQVIYIHQGINGKSLVFRASLLSKLNDNGQISHWIYTADQAMLQQADEFWKELNNYKPEL